MKQDIHKVSAKTKDLRAASKRSVWSGVGIAPTKPDQDPILNGLSNWSAQVHHSELFPVSVYSWFNRWLKRRRTKKLQRKCPHCYKKADQQTNRWEELCEICKLSDWLRNYRLNDVNSFSLFNEFLEMGMSQMTRARGQGSAY